MSAVRIAKKFKKLVLQIRCDRAHELCHKAWEMTQEEWLNECFLTVISVYNKFGYKKAFKVLPRIIVSEFNQLNWDHDDDLNAIFLPYEVLQTADVELGEDSLNY